ncbi:hypothetical protein SSBR45G_37850 [Bradyrhizobium sp. SSBR45G]|uniref:hypothetical protein n=1 Tax=unclassified Bradyrhizobium TaxID=2631580 RepID=UPI002342A023|nr:MULTISPECIES: hypothetical protein [unclassified Bradyrhizobium]GLH78876.1 hypothetical protein SSBR45G_37850 [Bradyrhizobium sp. SSBR45G]GLH86410.1 hypothetical protein SSBR45R_38700 [Bradyrhizobium sp. SSBR45R]
MNQPDLQLILQILPAVAGVIGLCVAVLSLLAFRTILKERSQSTYDEKKNRAALSEMRLSYETQIADINRKLTATERRWNDVNHLLVSSQEAQKSRVFGSKPEQHLTSFLESMRVTEADLEIDPKLIFVLMPFDDESRPLFDSIRKVCFRLDLRCLRGDEQNATGDVMSHILRLMVRARLIVADVGARNPNVFYELGIAHALDKQTVLISKSIADVPFDLRSNRVVIFNSNEQLEVDLTATLARVFATTEKAP